MSVSNCGHDERGRYTGGIAGDQSGTEWYICSWYSYPWNYVLHHPNAKVRAKIAQLAKEAANNNKIGYDQTQRGTFWTQLQKAGYYPSRITTACEADCSSGVAAIVKAVGYILGIQSLKNVPTTAYTGNLRRVLEAAGFETRSSSKYLTSEAYASAGDIWLNTAYHTCIQVTDGRYAAPTPTTSSSASFHVLTVDGLWGPSTTKRVQQVLGTVQDGIVSGQDPSCFRSINDGGLITSSWKTGTGGSLMVKAMQRKLGINADGQFGPKTCKALQKRMGTTVDGKISKPSDCVKALQKRLNKNTF